LNKNKFFEGCIRIGSDGYDCKLEEDKYDDDLFIVDPINIKNIAKGKCKGDTLKHKIKHI
jgi:hypothetical protein